MSMAIPYPSLCATRRAWTPGEYPTRRFTAVNGAARLVFTAAAHLMRRYSWNIYSAMPS